MSTVAPPGEISPTLESRDQTADLVVSWQHPVTRAASPVALLSKDHDGYVLRYLRSAANVDGFRSLLGFPDLEKTYRSPDLFPLFAQRAMEASRRDYSRYMAELGLAPEATPWEQIVRSGGDMAGDTLKVSPMPRLIKGFWYCVSPVTGIEYLTTKSVVMDGQTYGPYSLAQIDSIVGNLSVGAPVTLRHETANDYSDAATLAVSGDGSPFGYLPDWLARLLHDFVGQDSSMANVDQIKRHADKWYVRILIKLDRKVGPSLESLLGEGWETFAD